MKITLCGSVAFIAQMEAVAGELERLGHEVQFPPVMKSGEHGELIPTLEYYQYKKQAVGDPNHWVWKTHDQPIREHFEKVAWSDAILVLNYDKNNIPGYIGPNTLMEMGLAFWLEKPIYLLNPIPQLAHTEEIRGVKPVVIDGDLTKLSSEILV